MALLLFFKERREQIAHGCPFLRATWANRSGRSVVRSVGSESLNLLFKKEQMSEDRCERFALGHKKGEKLSKTYKNTIFWVNHSYFASDSLESWANHSRHSLLNSESLGMALLLRATWANRSLSLFCKERHEQIAHDRSFKWAILSERVKERKSKERNSERAN